LLGLAVARAPFQGYSDTGRAREFQPTAGDGWLPPESSVTSTTHLQSMRSRRYTIVVADRRTGVVRRFTLSLWPTLMTVSGVLALPVLIGTGAAIKARYEVAAIYTTASLQSAMDKLPAVVKNRAMGGGTSAAAALGVLPALQTPENTFGLLRELLEGIESRLRSVQVDVDNRNALAAATPSIWPAHGWLTSRVGSREDPITGGRDFHPGLDISADHGSPVYATADGTVVEAERQTGYGNLIVVEHGYGLESRYGHLSRYKARTGEKVKRGDVLGFVGSTGRSTGSHLHYEVRLNGRLLNPLQLLLNYRR
jgi:murein DD-endopeptidase MepM/ murein hydrolase activator NlpD